MGNTLLTLLKLIPNMKIPMEDEWELFPQVGTARAIKSKSVMLLVWPKMVIWRKVSVALKSWCGISCTGRMSFSSTHAND